MCKYVKSLRLVSVVSFSSCIFYACNTADETPPIDNETIRDTGFVSLSDGETLAGWDGDTAVWRVTEGVIVGEVTESSTPLKSNTFLIWTGGTPGNFELTGEYEISEKGNSGIQYRSEKVDGVPFGLRGYQCDIDGANTYTGQNYEERARAIMAFRGQKVMLPNVNEPIAALAKNNRWSVSQITDSLGNSDSLKGLIHDGWNTFRIVADGNHLQHYINGVLMCDVTDDDTTNRKASGLLGLQLHAGHIMRVAFKNLKLKEL